jgi:hypothetical protein
MDDHLLSANFEHLFKDSTELLKIKLVEPLPGNQIRSIFIVKLLVCLSEVIGEQFSVVSELVEIN